jgi:DNA-binding MarR family transcriptional regulator
MKTRLTLANFIDELIYQVVLGNRYLSDAAELPDSEYKTLRFIERHSNVHLKDVAAFLGVSPPRASAVIDQLVLKKLVLRSVGENRREISLSLTKAGKSALSEAQAMHNDLSEAILSPLDKREREQMYVLLEKCYQSLKDQCK